MIQKSYSTERVNFAACLAMTFFGVAMLSLGVILPHLVAEVPAAIGLPPFLSVGIILGTIVFGPIMDRSGYKNLLIVSTVLLLAGLLLLASCRDINLLRFAIFLVGFGAGIINGETNAIVSDIYEDDKRGRKLSILGACYCVGALVWTLTGYFIQNFKIPLYVFAAIMVLSAVFFILTDFPSAKLGAKSEGKSGGANIFAGFISSFKFLKYPALVLVAFVLFFQSAFEGTSGSYTTSFLKYTPEGLDVQSATLSLTFFTIGMMFGRFALSGLMKIMSKLMVMNLYMVIGVSGVLLMFFFPANVTFVFLAMALIGFGVGSTFPVMVDYLGSIFRRQSGAAFSIAMFIALTGQFLGNFLVGKLFTENARIRGDYMLFPIALAMIIFVILVLAPFAVRAAKKLRETNEKKGLGL